MKKLIYLLSYAFFEIREGNTGKATPLLALYLLVIGILFTVGGVLKQVREFGSGTYLNNISFLIQLCLFETLIRGNDSLQKEKDVYKELPSRKRKKV
jgi:hypothetical protein